MPRPIKGPILPANSNAVVSAAVLKSPPQPTFPRWMVEDLIAGLLATMRKQDKEKTLRRLMRLLDSHHPELESTINEKTHRLALRVESLVRQRTSGSDHPDFALEHHARLLKQLVAKFPFSSNEDLRSQWLREHLPAVLAKLKERSYCQNCNKRVSPPPHDKLLDMARCRYPGKLRNKILAYHHRLSISTVQRLIASSS